MENIQDNQQQAYGNLTVPDIATNGGANTQVADKIENIQQVRDMSNWDAIKLGVRNSSYAQMVQDMLTTSEFGTDVYQDDPQFRSLLTNRIQNEFPDATQAEKEHLATAANAYEYDVLKHNMTTKQKEQALIEESKLGGFAQDTVNMSGSLIAGMAAAGPIGGIASAGMRFAAAFGVNALVGGAEEAFRQRAMREDTSLAGVAAMTAMSGLIGGVFDGTSSELRAAIAGKFKENMRRLFRMKAKGEIEAEANVVAKEAADVGAQATPTPVPALRAPMTAEEKAAVEAAGGIPFDKSPIASTISDLFKSSSKAMEEDAVHGFKFIDQYGSESQRAFAQDLAKANHMDPHVVAHESTRVAQMVSPNAAKVAGADAAVTTVTHADGTVIEKVKPEVNFVDYRNPETYVPQSMKAVAEAERAVPEELLKGRLKLRDGENLSIKPVFESPIDRSLAIVGSSMGDTATQAAHLAVLRNAFKGETDETILAAAEDYVDGHLMPSASLLKGGAPRVSRFWDRIDMSKYRPAELEKVFGQAEHALAHETGQAAEASMPLMAADTTGEVRSSAVKGANELVTPEAINSGFSKVAKSDPMYGVSQHLKGFSEAMKEATGSTPTVLHMRLFAANQLYARKMLDAAVKAGKSSGLSVRFIAITGGLALALGASQDANAGAGSATASVALEGAMLIGGGLFMGAAAFRKAMMAAGKWSSHAVNFRQARAMLEAGEDIAKIEKETGYKVIEENGTKGLYHPVTPEGFPEMTAGKTTKELDAMAEETRAVTDKEVKRVSLDVDHERNIQAMRDVGAVGYERVELAGQHMEFPESMPGARPQFTNASVSQTWNGVMQHSTSSQMTRVGKVARINDFDSMGAYMRERFLAEAEANFGDAFKAFCKESGRQRYSFNPLSKVGQESYAAFNAELKRAHDFPDAPDLLPSVVTLRKQLSASREAVVQEARQIIKEVEAAGHVVGPDSPLRKLADLVNEENFYRRIVHKEKWQDTLAKVGVEGMKQLIVDGFKKANPKLLEILDDKQFKEIGDAIFRGYSKAAGDLTVFVSDEVAQNLQAVLNKHNVPLENIDAVMEDVGVHRTNHAPSTLKRRTALDTNVSIKVTGPDGKETEVFLKDIYEDDLFNTHISWMAPLSGILALSKSGMGNGMKYFVDFADDTVWNELTARAMSEGATAEEMQFSVAIRNRLLGRVKEADQLVIGGAGPIERFFQQGTTLPLAQYFAAAQGGELGGLGAAGFLRSVARLHKFYGLSTDVMGRSLPEGLAKDLAYFAGIGARSVSTRGAAASDEFGIRMLSRMDKAANFAFKVNGITGNKANIEHDVSHDMLLTLYKYATGETIPANTFKHMSAYGIDKASADELAPLLRKYVKTDSVGVVRGLDATNFKSENVRLYSQLEMAMRRAMNTANSEPSGLGETRAWVRQNSAMRFFSKFMGTASFASMRTMKEIKNFDSTIAGKWVMSFMASSLASYLRIYLRYRNEPDKLEEQLTPANLLIQGLRGSSFSGLSMNGLDAVLIAAGFPSSTAATGTASGRSSGIEPPIVGVVKTGIQATRAINQAILGDDYSHMKRSDWLAIQKLALPLLPVSVVVDEMTKDLPNKDPKRPKEAKSWWTEPLAN